MLSWQPPYRSSKLRHVYGEAAAKAHGFQGLPITRGVHDNHSCSVNPRFIAVVTECTGGGAFIVLPIRQQGRVEPQCPRVCGHSGRVLDVKWDPFNDQRIASCSEDCTVKIWEIPSYGVKENISVPSKVLLGHAHRVGLIEWHPTARDILLSAAYDFSVCVWRVDGVGAVLKTPVCVIGSHTDLVLSVSFSEDGSKLATACRDRTLRISEPRTGRTLQCSTLSRKVCKVVFLTNFNLLLTTGYSQWNQRQFVLWDPEDLSEPLLEEDLDGGAGVLFPFYDPDTHMLYLAGKGDGNIRYYEVSAEKPYIHFLAEYRSLLPHRGMGVMPKRGLNTRRCEVFRFYRLVSVTDVVELLSFIVPRKSDDFQEDLYPMTASNEAAVTAGEWLAGVDRGPVLMSLRPGTQVQNPYPAPQQRVGAENSAALQKPECDEGADEDELSAWHEDGTLGNGGSQLLTDTHFTDTHWGPGCLESPAYAAPASETELMKVFYRQQEEIGSLREQLDQRDSRIQQLELEVKHIRNQLRASF